MTRSWFCHSFPAKRKRGVFPEIVGFFGRADALGGDKGNRNPRVPIKLKYFALVSKKQQREC